MKSITRNVCFRWGASRSQKPVTRKMVRELAVALAEVHGRPAQEVSKSDWERAKWELAGEPDSDPKEAGSESESGEPAPGTICVKGSEHDQKLRAARMEKEQEEA